MEPEFWREKWESNQIGFHLPEPHPLLIKHWASLGLEEGFGRVFVPLCGKSGDMVWLRSHGHEVLGVEISDKAIDDFKASVGGDFIEDQVGSLRRSTGQGYVLVVGDYFQLDRNLLGAITATYDRAALIALPPEMRRAYVQLQRDLLVSGVQILLITLEYDESIMQGPPFSVDESEVGSLYADWCEIELLETVPAELPDRSIDGLEKCYRLRVL